MLITTVFLALALVGLLFLGVSIFFHHDVHSDFDSGSDISEGTPGWVSFRTLAVFLLAFGTIGALTNHYSAQGAPLKASLLGLGGGVVLVAVYLVFMRLVYSQQASSLVTDDDLAGAEGRVTTGIPEGGAGEVSCSVGGVVTRRLARTRDRRAIEEGEIVRVLEVHGDSVVVEPAKG